MEEEQKQAEKELLADVHVDELKQRIQAYHQTNQRSETQQQYMHQMLGQMIEEKQKQTKRFTAVGIGISLAAAFIGYAGSIPWLFY